jgi:hypothetical protein
MSSFQRTREVFLVLEPRQPAWQKWVSWPWCRSESLWSANTIGGNDWHCFSNSDHPLIEWLTILHVPPLFDHRTWTLAQLIIATFQTAPHPPLCDMDGADDPVYFSTSHSLSTFSSVTSADVIGSPRRIPDKHSNRCQTGCWSSVLTLLCRALPP